jgi:hypothetical protein
MQKKPAAKAPNDIVEILHSLLKHMDDRFDAVGERFEKVFTRLDRIEFLLTAQERRISILEDRMRVVGTKLGLEFRKEA